MLIRVGCCAVSVRVDCRVVLLCVDCCLVRVGCVVFPPCLVQISFCYLIIIIIIINLIYIAQFDNNGILTALYIVITYIQMQYVHV